MSEAEAIDLFDRKLETDGKLIEYVVRKARFPRTATFGRDDIRASALRSFYKAVTHYNGDGTFAGFYVIVAMNDLTNDFRANAHAVQMPYNKRDYSLARRVELDAPCSIEGYSKIDWIKVSHDDPVRDAMGPKSVAELTTILKRVLPPQTYDMLMDACGIERPPLSSLGVARKYGITHQAVACRIARARIRLLRTPAFLRWVQKEYGLSFSGNLLEINHEYQV